MAGSRGSPGCCFSPSSTPAVASGDERSPRNPSGRLLLQTSLLITTSNSNRCNSNPSNIKRRHSSIRYSKHINLPILIAIPNSSSNRNRYIRMAQRRVSHAHISRRLTLIPQCRRLSSSTTRPTPPSPRSSSLTPHSVTFPSGPGSLFSQQRRHPPPFTPQTPSPPHHYHHHHYHSPPLSARPRADTRLPECLLVLCSWQQGGVRREYPRNASIDFSGSIREGAGRWNGGDGGGGGGE
ncbi:hypothetical protein O3P69_013328 [Scylla paramamosain]|uniref:Uncharacterized protein n=1 Tax=Scylla paramamosain TaxID=85552 RepID=A0AAW0TZP6_SCYPA